MKIFAVACNYDAPGSVNYFGNQELPCWYEIPDSAILRSGQPFFIPDFAADFRVFPSLICRISRLGKAIAPKFATRYILEGTLGCSAIAVDLLTRLRHDGLPWSRAVAFDKACMIGAMMPLERLTDSRCMLRCGDNTLSYDPRRMRHDIPEVISLLSRDNTLKEGDLILMALTPAGLPLLRGDRLTADITCLSESFRILDINIR